MLLRKTPQGYEISGGKEWYPYMPGKVTTRKQFDAHYQGRDKVSYATDAFAPGTLFEVYWFNGKFPMAKEDELHTLVIDLPAYSSDEQITDYLRQRAKTSFNKEAVIRFMEARPEPPEPEE